MKIYLKEYVSKNGDSGPFDAVCSMGLRVLAAENCAGRGSRVHCQYMSQSWEVHAVFGWKISPKNRFLKPKRTPDQNT